MARVQLKLKTTQTRNNYLEYLVGVGEIAVAGEEDMENIPWRTLENSIVHYHYL